MFLPALVYGVFKFPLNPTIQESVFGKRKHYKHNLM